MQTAPQLFLNNNEIITSAPHETLMVILIDWIGKKYEKKSLKLNGFFSYALGRLLNAVNIRTAKISYSAYLESKIRYSIIF